MPRRTCLIVLTAAALAGCADGVSTQTTAIPATPNDVVEAAPPAGAAGASANTAATQPQPDPAATPASVPAAPAAAPSEAPQAAVAPAGLPSLDEAAPATEADLSGVSLKRLNWEQFQRQVVANPNARLTIVDAWATTCGPCKENFPHLVAMSKKYAEKGLAAVSLTLDDREDAQAVADAEKFLREQGATFTNVLLDEDFGTGYEKLDINAIPAVFVFGPDGKEVKRYTLDDPNSQFTYEQVEKDVAAMLEAQ